MKVDISPGKYVLALSGGVDSMVLLDILSKHEHLELIAAHYNHGIRAAATRDEDFVRAIAKDYGLLFEAGHGKLGPLASEAEAREARYAFLAQVKQKYEADAIITAHHQDDLIETALINILRGTGPKGLIAIASSKDILRPLLPYPKEAILNYANQEKLEWVEDETNEDIRYLRNYIRRELVPRMSQAEREKTLSHIDKIKHVHRELELVISKLSKKVLIDERTINRSSFISLPPEIANSFLYFWFNELNVSDIDRKTITRLSTVLKTGAVGSQHKIKNGNYLKLSKKEAYFTS
ncbi:tRNA lysidine(34) synthetase TilS [Candidatus Saccharibacteria bacterium]|nr:tRNA lysidine(34) synthetase TilS [Candidatus Saccharibacteria bacterium]